MTTNKSIQEKVEDIIANHTEKIIHGKNRHSSIITCPECIQAGLAKGREEEHKKQFDILEKLEIAQRKRLEIEKRCHKNHLRNYCFCDLEEAKEQARQDFAKEVKTLIIERGGCIEDCLCGNTIFLCNRIDELCKH